MRKPVSYKDLTQQSRQKFIKVRPLLEDRKLPRTRPRPDDEALAIMLATVEKVQKAKADGRWVKLEKGYRFKCSSRKK